MTGGACLADSHDVAASDFEPQLRTLLATVDPGSQIVLPAGHFVLRQPIVLDIPGVTVRGQGREKTVLDFSKQTAGGQSFVVLSNDAVIRDLRIVDPPADGLVARRVRNLEIHGVGVEWTGKPRSSNGGYGIYPVQSENVTIDSCYARGASEAGIYVGQSVDGVIANSFAEENVIGIDVENSVRIRVESNVVEDNSIGVVVAARPGLLQMHSVDVTVSSNRISTNNRPNFARKGSFVAAIGDGIGVAVIASRGAAVRANRFSEHRHSHLLLLDYSSLGLSGDRDDFFRPGLVGAELSSNLFDSPASVIPHAESKSWREVSGVDVLWDGILPLSVSSGVSASAPICQWAQPIKNFFNAASGAYSRTFPRDIPGCTSEDSEPVKRKVRN